MGDGSLESCRRHFHPIDRGNFRFQSNFPHDQVFYWVKVVKSRRFTQLFQCLTSKGQLFTRTTFFPQNSPLARAGLQVVHWGLLNECSPLPIEHMPIYETRRSGNSVPRDFSKALGRRCFASRPRLPGECKLAATLSGPQPKLKAEQLGCYNNSSLSTSLFSSVLLLFSCPFRLPSLNADGDGISQGKYFHSYNELKAVYHLEKGGSSPRKQSSCQFSQVWLLVK